MSDATTIKINPAKNSDLEFDVMIQGIDDINIPAVRFVITSEVAQCDYAFRCKRVEGEKYKWVASLPALEHVKESTVPFHVEVIVDGYYFEPAQGTVILVTDPTVKFQPSVSKPTVTTSFVVKQSEDKPVETAKDTNLSGKQAEEDEQVNAQYSNNISPSNTLLTPEEEPTKSSVKTAQATKDDQSIDHTRLSDLGSSVTPGETTDPEPQRGNNYPSGEEGDEGDEREFNPKRIAESIVRKTVGGSAQRPQTQGTLFQRDKAGNIQVKGIDTPNAKATKAANAQKVKDILGNT